MTRPMRSQQLCGRFTLDFPCVLRYNSLMAENPFEPTANTESAPAPEPVAEPVVAPVTPVVEEKPSIMTEEPETETEIKDEEKLEEPENQFEELDEDLTDMEESTDTVWLLRRVGGGIIKTLLVLGGIGLVGWLIWGGGTDKPSVVKVPSEKPVIEKPVEKKETPTKNIQAPQKKKQENSQKEIETSVLVVMSAAGRSLSTWNYWMETQRLAGQKGTPAAALAWKRDVEILFEIPFPSQIDGATPVIRNLQVGRLLQRIEYLLARADALQKQLSQDIVEFSSKAEISKKASLIAEQEFLDALKNSNPVGISSILDKKIEAEKLLQQNAVDAEARRIFAQKISEYTLILENLQTVLVANRAAIVQDIRVVNFPSDPFGRVIAPGAWTQQGQ